MKAHFLYKLKFSIPIIGRNLIDKEIIILEAQSEKQKSDLIKLRHSFNIKSYEKVYSHLKNQDIKKRISSFQNSIAEFNIQLLKYKREFSSLESKWHFISNKLNPENIIKRNSSLSRVSMSLYTTDKDFKELIKKIGDLK